MGLCVHTQSHDMHPIIIMVKKLKALCHGSRMRSMLTFDPIDWLCWRVTVHINVYVSVAITVVQAKPPKPFESLPPFMHISGHRLTVAWISLVHRLGCCLTSYTWNVEDAWSQHEILRGLLQRHTADHSVHCGNSVVQIVHVVSTSSTYSWLRNQQ